MSQNETEQPDEAQAGAKPSFAARSESVLSTLENRLQEFGNLVISVNVMNKSLTAIRSELDDIKATKTGASDRREASEQPDTAPPSKRPRTESMDTGSDDDEDPITIYMRDQEDEEEEEDPEVEDLIADLSMFFTDDEEVGPKIDEGLAKMANAALRGKAQPEKLKKLAEKYKRPENVDNLQSPKVEEILWRQLRKDSKGIDYVLQKNQSSLSVALVPIIKAVGILHSSKTKEMNPLKELITDAFKILSLSVTNNHEIRREKIKKELDPKYKGICNKEASTTKLFGDQLQESIKTMGSSKFNLTLHQSSRKSFLGKRRGGARSFPRHNNYSTYNSSSNNNNNSRPRYRNQQGQRYNKRGQNKK